MSDEKVLNKAIAEQFLEDPFAIDLQQFTEINDDAADVIGRFYKQSLRLDGITFLSPQSASSLAKIPDSLYFRGLKELPIEVAKELSTHGASGYSPNLVLGVTKLSDAAASCLAHYRGQWIQLDGLQVLSESTASALGRFCGESLSLTGIKNMTQPAAEGLAAFAGTMFLYGLQSISDDVAAVFGNKSRGELHLVNRDPFPPASDVALLELARSPVCVVDHETGKRMSTLVKKTLGPPRLSNAQHKEIRERLKAKDSSAVNEVCDKMQSSDATGADFLKAFPVTRIKTLLTMWSPEIWESLANVLFPYPHVFANLCRTAGGVFANTSNDSKYLHGLRGMLGALLMSNSDSLVACIDCCVQKIDFQLCFDDFQGSLPPQDCHPSYGLTAVSTSVSKKMAISLARVDGFLSLSVKNLDAETAQILAGRDGSLSLVGLEEISDATATTLAENRRLLILDYVSSLSDTTAKVLASHKGEGLSLNGLTILSDTGAKSLSTYEGELRVDLNDIPESAAAILGKHPSFAIED